MSNIKFEGTATIECKQPCEWRKGYERRNCKHPMLVCLSCLLEEHIDAQLFDGVYPLKRHGKIDIKLEDADAKTD